MNNTEQIIRFLSNEMEANEMTNFNLLLKENPELEKEYLWLQKLWKYMEKELRIERTEDRKLHIAEIMAKYDIETYKANTHPSDAEKELIASLKMMMADDATKSPKQRKLWYKNGRLILIAAASITLMFIIIRPWTNTDTLVNMCYMPQNEHLVAQQSFVTRSDTVDGLQLFKKENYAEALPLLDLQHNLHPENKTIEFCLAISKYESGEIAASIQHLEKLTKSKQKEISELSSWYLSLIYIKEDHPKKARDWLILVEADDGIYSKSAKKLLRKL